MLIFHSWSIWSRNVDKRRNVADNKGEVIIGANVVIKDTYDGTSSDIDGGFSFSTGLKKDCKLLQVSYIGYTTYEQEIDLQGGKFNLEIRPGGGIE